MRHIELARHFKSGRFLGFAHIEFYNKKSVFEALEGKDETTYVLNGKEIICKRKLLKVEIDKSRGEDLIKTKYLAKSGNSKENEGDQNSEISQKKFLKKQKNEEENWEINLIFQNDDDVKTTPRKHSWNYHDIQKTTTSKKGGFMSNYNSNKNKGRK